MDLAGSPIRPAAELHHDPAFYEVLPPEQQRTRPRLRAIADSYFDTVEANDGQVFAPFDEDCGRLENGRSTTSRSDPNGAFGAVALAEGCEAQFKLGIYRINKRIRERRYPIIDTERGIVVASAFFDHANEFDSYKLTDGRDMKTALKWPNSITLLEAFRIRNAEISRIEAVFTYVPYFMHNPFWGPAAMPPADAPDPRACDESCVAANTNAVMAAYPVRGQWASLPWADKVGYAENSVGIRVNEGIWQGVTAVDASPLVIADATTGKGVWIGRIEEHGQPSWAAITVTSNGRQISDIDAVIRRKEYGAPYVEPTAAPSFAPVPQAQRTSRAAMIAGADAFYAAMNAHGGKAPAGLADTCKWLVNGQDVGDCAPPFSGPVLAGIKQVRDREVLAVDETRGLVVYRTFEDLPASANTEGSYPLTYQVIELFRFVGGKIERVEAFTSELPYGMKPHDAR
jgi:hypothetical protein